MIQGLPDKAVINDLKAFNAQCLNVSSASSGRRMLQSEDSAPEVTQCDDGKPHTIIAGLWACVVQTN